MTVNRKITQLPSRDEFTGDEYFHVGFNGNSYKTTINKLVEHFTDGVTAERLNNVKDILADIGEADSIVTKDELSEALDNIVHPVTDLSNYATHQDVTDAIAIIPPVDLSEYSTHQNVADVVAAIPPVDLTDYATHQNVADAIDAIPDVDLSNYATHQNVSDAISAIPPVDFTGLATEQFVSDAIDAIPDPDFTGLATEQYVTDAIDAIPDVDLTDYTTHQNVADAISAIPPVDFTGLATEQYVIDAIDSIPDVDLSGYASKNFVTNSIAAIPPVDLSSYASKNFVTNAIAAIPPVDLSGYASKNFVTNAIGDIVLPDLSIYSTTSQMTQAISDAVESVNPISKVELSNMLFVTGQEVTGADGSISKPFKSLQQAINASTDSNIIIVTSSLNTEGEVTIHNKSNIVIQGYGCNGSHPVIIYGNIILSGNTTRVRLKDIAVRPDSGKIGIEDKGTEGRHYLDNVDITTNGAEAFKATDGAKRWTALTSCTVTGDIVVDNVNANFALYLNNHNSFGTDLYVNSSCSVSISNAIQMGYIENNAGKVNVRGVTAFRGKAGKAIAHGGTAVSTYASFCDFDDGTGTYLEVDLPVVTKMCNEN